MLQGSTASRLVPSHRTLRGGQGDKSGNKADQNNYRPASVISAIAGLFERQIYNHFYSYLTRYKLLNSKQSGFRLLYSTVKVLLDLTNDWYFNIDRGMVSSVIFFYLKKAFDTVDHSVLMTKSEYFEFSHSSLQWFYSYLSNGLQRCFLNGMYSDSENSLWSSSMVDFRSTSLRYLYQLSDYMFKIRSGTNVC